MLIIIIEIFLSLVSFISGFLITYAFISGANNYRNPWLLLVSLSLTAFGLYLFIHVEKLFNTIISGGDLNKHDLQNKSADGTKAENIIDKNRKIAEEWSETVEKRDKMKMLKTVASAAEKLPE